MYEIKKAQSDLFSEIKNFLNEVPTLGDIDEEVIKNASVLYLDNNIHGIISFESFHNYALIRYFIFKRTVDEMIVKELFVSVLETIKANNIEYVFSIVNQNEILDLFTALDFYEVSKENVFIEEQNLRTSKFKDTKLLIRKVSI